MDKSNHHKKNFGIIFELSLKLKTKNIIIMAKEFTDANFQKEVIESSQLTMIDFWAEWCGPCRAIGPVVEELAKQYEGKINVGKLNVDLNPNTSINYGITSIPAILFIKDGKIVDKQVGAVPKTVLEKKILAQL